MLASGLGGISDVFISVWLVSRELAVWATLVQCYIDHSPMQTMRGEFLREMPSTEAANWNRLCVCLCVCFRVCVSKREKKSLYACI